MKARLDEQYFVWLYHQTGSATSGKRSTTYWSLMNQLHSTEFAWFVLNDDNRAEDGRDLRREFVDSAGVRFPKAWESYPCSMLEMLVALARRMAFEIDETTQYCFWHILLNTQLAEYNDAVYPSHEVDVSEIIETIIWRTYSRDGRGGLFPLEDPEHDQTGVELWYQLNAYILENYS